MITVALPTWNNKDIVWLTIEGLCRQVTKVPWELIISECKGENECSKKYFMAYESRLKKVGCVRIVYIYNQERLALSRKWVQMYKVSKGRFFCLQGSDDYPHPTRNQDVWNAKVDWFDCRKYYQYHVKLRKLIQYDFGQTNDMPREKWRTGFNMAIRSSLMEKVPVMDVRKSVDGFLLKYTDPKTRFVDQRVLPGVSTTGMNSISVKRYKYFTNPKPPFKATKQTILTIGLPIGVANALKRGGLKRS